MGSGRLESRELTVQAPLKFMRPARGSLGLLVTFAALSAAAAPASPPPEPPPPAAGPAPPSEPAPSAAPPTDAPVAPAQAPAAAVDGSDAAGANAPAAVPSPASKAEPVESGSGLFEQSQADAPASTAAGSAPASGFTLNGYVRGDVYAGKVPARSQGEMKAAYGELALKLQLKKEKFGDAFAEARFRSGLQGRTQATNLDLREAYANLYAGPLDLRLGRQIIVWGRADAFNPTNNLTPVDLRVRSPVEDDRRLANVGARAFLNFSPIRVEGVWMPLYAASELPDIALPAGVVMGPTSFPSPRLGNGLGAGRVHLEEPGFELSASYLFGYAPLPGLAMYDYSVGAQPQVRITRTAYEQHVLGFDFSTVLGDYLGVRGEAAYRRPQHYGSRLYAPRPDLNYVLGLDHTFGTVSVIAQYIGGYVFDWQREPGPVTPLDPSFLSGLSDPVPPLVAQTIADSVNQDLAKRNQILFGQRARLRHAASVRLEWLTLHDTLSLSTLTMVNFTTREWLAYPKVTYHLSDNMSASVGAEIYAGPRDTLFGLIDEELSAGYAEMRFAF